MKREVEVIFKNENMEILHLETEPFGTNAYMVICREGGESVLIDTPGDAKKIKGLLEPYKVGSILLTHGHMDHTVALEELYRDLNAPLAAHENDAVQLPLKPDQLLAGGEQIRCGKINLEVIHTPGHTPGSLCFKTGNYLFSGDTIFPGGPGKTRSPKEFKQIVSSIEEKIMTLPDDTVILPGHGEKTDLKTERKLFNNFRSGRQNFEFSGDVTWLGT